MTMPKPNTSAYSTRFACLPWPEIGLLILYVGVRIHALTNLPVFVDEAIHITWTRRLLMGDLGGAAMGVHEARPLVPWVLALFIPLTNGLWMSRAAVVLFSTMSLAALIALGRLLLHRRVGMIAGLVYVMLPFFFFFERMVTPDPLAASLGWVTTWLTVVALTSRRPGVAALAGIVLVLAILAKLPMLIWIAVPCMGWLLLTRHEWKTFQVLLRICITTLILILTPIIALSRFTDFGFMYATRTFTSFDPLALPERFLGNMQAFVRWMGAWLGWPVLVAGGLGIGWAMLRRRRQALFLVTLISLPLLEFWTLGRVIFARYYLPGIGALVLLATWLALQAVDWLHRKTGLSHLWAVSVLIATLLPMIRFILTAYIDPAILTLPEDEGADFLRNQFSGYAPRDAARWMEEYAPEVSGVTILCPLSSTCDMLEVYLYGTPGIRFASLDDLSPAWLQAETEAGRMVLFPRESASPAELFAPLQEYRVELIHSFPRPLGGETLSLYQVESEK